MSFEMAHSDNPEEIILATQRSMIEGMRGVIAGMKKDMKQPGLTWEQIDYFLVEFGKKKPTIVKQEFTQ